MSDDQMGAEQFDEDLVGGDDPVTSDEASVDFPPDRPMGLPFADADVTDESLAERHAREEPEVWEGGGGAASSTSVVAADEQLDLVIDTNTD